MIAAAVAAGLAGGLAGGGGGGAAGKGGRKKAPLPAKFFLSKPKATAWVNKQLVAVNQGGWAIKTTDIFIYWYVDIDGEWLRKAAGWAGVGLAGCPVCGRNLPGLVCNTTVVLYHT